MLRKRRNLRVILASATLDVDPLVDFFSSPGSAKDDLARKGQTPMTHQQTARFKGGGNSVLLT